MDRKRILIISISVLSAILLFSTAFISVPPVKALFSSEPASSSTRPVAVMVENSFAARPQSGLNLADVVIEAVDEYGITRFVAIYNSNEAPVVGPVRSARPYYAEFANAFNPIYVFFGTYPECYGMIEQTGMYVLSAMTDRSGNSSITAQAPYWRDWGRSSVQEHTAFMSVSQLKQRAQALGYDLSGGGIPFHFKGDSPLDQRGGVSQVNIDFSTTVYHPRGFDVNFIYNRDTNSYFRYMGGYPHKDYNTGQQINVKNVAVMVTDIEGPLDAYGHMYIRTVGSGPLYFFNDGNVVEGFWARDSINQPFEFRSGNGSVIEFTGGATWIAVVQDTGKISYQ